MKTKTTTHEGVDAAGWKFWELRDAEGNLLESRITNPTGSYVQHQLHYAISAKAIDEFLYGP